MTTDEDIELMRWPSTATLEGPSISHAFPLNDSRVKDLQTGHYFVETNSACVKIQRVQTNRWPEVTAPSMILAAFQLKIRMSVCIALSLRHRQNNPSNLTDTHS